MPLSDPLLGFDAPPLNVGQPAQPAQPSAKEKWGKAAPILAMIPLILQKGGPQGLAMFLAARQQAQEQKRQQGLAETDRASQQQRLASQDQRLVQQDQWQQQYQQGLLNDRAAERDNQVRDSFIKGLQSATDESQVQALVEMYSSAMPRESLEKIARQVASTERLMEKRVQAFLRGADEGMVQQWIEGRGTLQVDGKPVPFEQWSKFVPMAMDADGKPITSKKPADDLTKSSIAVQAAEALRRGDTAEYNRLLQVQKAVGLADNTPRAVNTGVQDQRRFNMEQRLVAQWDKANTPIREMRRQYGLMDAGLKRFRAGDTNGGSQAVLVTFQKILDPTSVVRESEYARTTQGQSLINRIEGYASRLAQGGTTLTDAEMAAMVQTARQFLDGMATYTAGLRQRIERTAGEYQLDTRMIFDDVGAPTEAPSTAPASTPSAAPPRIKKVTRVK